MALFQIRFPYGTNQVVIRSNSEIPDEFAEGVSTFLKFASEDLNSVVKGSSAYKFNNADVDFPVDISGEFIKFLELLTSLQRLNPDIHFFDQDINEDTLIIDKERRKLIKKTELTFNSKGLRTPFILDAVKNYLVEEANFPSFLIIYSNYFSASGDEEWKLPFPELSIADHATEIGLIDSATILSEYNKNTNKSSASKFGYTPLFNDPEYVLVNTDSLTRALLLSDMTHSLVHDLDFQKFSKDSDSKIMVKTKSGGLFKFPE